MDILIRNSLLTRFERAPGDVTALPPDASLFAAADWTVMCAQAGGEGALMLNLGVTEAIDANGPI